MPRTSPIQKWVAKNCKFAQTDHFSIGTFDCGDGIEYSVPKVATWAMSHCKPVQIAISNLIGDLLNADEAGLDEPVGSEAWKSRAGQVDLSKPIIVIRTKHGLMVADGNHRLWQAHSLGNQQISAYVIDQAKLTDEMMPARNSNSIKSASRTKFAMPLPKAKSYPSKLMDDGKPNSKFDMGLSALDKKLTPENAKNIEELHPEMTYLGHGGDGVAYDTQPGNVIKLTFEPSEALAASRLIKKPCRCVANIIDVAEVQQKTLEKKSKVWKITMEKLKPLEGDDKTWTTYFFNYILSTSRLPEPKKIVQDLTEESYYDEHLKLGVSMAALPHNILYSFMPYYRKYIALLQCLEHNGLSSQDAHEDNIGTKPDGAYAVFDLGWLIK